MEFKVELNKTIVTVKLLRKRTTKHTYLRVISPSMLQISTNRYFTNENAFTLIENKRGWLEKKLKQMDKNSLNDDEFYFLGVKHKNLDNRNLDRFYKDEAKRVISPLVEKYSQEMKLYPTSIKFRKNKNTWGSCNYKNGLNFNTLLVKFPLEVVEYVVIHELAHIQHKNHSKEFWRVVENYCSDYKSREKLLKSLL